MGESIEHLLVNTCREETKVLETSEQKIPKGHAEELTIGSEWRIADWKRDDEEGVARIALTMFAPALCPAMVILEAEPPKLGTTVCKKPRALITSATARL